MRTYIINYEFSTTEATPNNPLYKRFMSVIGCESMNDGCTSTIYVQSDDTNFLAKIQNFYNNYCKSSAYPEVHITILVVQDSTICNVRRFNRGSDNLPTEAYYTDFIRELISEKNKNREF